jgi:hypothetical protein
MLRVRPPRSKNYFSIVAAVVLVWLLVVVRNENGIDTVRGASEQSPKSDANANTNSRSCTTRDWASPEDISEKFSRFASLLVLQHKGQMNMTAAGDVRVLGDVLHVDVAAGRPSSSLPHLDLSERLWQDTRLRPKTISTVTKKSDLDDLRTDKTNAYDTIINLRHHNDASTSIPHSLLFNALKPGGLWISHDRMCSVQQRDDVHRKATAGFELIYEKEIMVREDNEYEYYWIGRKRVHTIESDGIKLAQLGKAMEEHQKGLEAAGFQEENMWGNIYNAHDMHQPKEYFSYASLPWVQTICEIGFAGGHSSVVYRTANPTAKLYSFDNMGKRDLSNAALGALQSKGGDITLTEGDSTVQVPRFVGWHPDVYCDVISVDGAHDRHFPDVDLHNFKYLANDPNIVLIDDYNPKDWPAVIRGVDKRIAEGSLELRHVSKNDVVFHNKGKQWAIGEYTMMTVVVATTSIERIASLTQLVHQAARHPAVQQVVVLWNSADDMPKQIQQLARLPSEPGNKQARVTVIATGSNSLNNRFDPSLLPIHTGAVVLLDDDLKVTQQTFTCLLNAYKQDPSRVYSIGEARYASKSDYLFRDIEGRENFLVPWMIFHRSFLHVYHDPAFQALRDNVDSGPRSL